MGRAFKVFLWIGATGSLAIVCLLLLSGPDKAPAHPFDNYRRTPRADGSALFGPGSSYAGHGPHNVDFDHIWILRSPDLQAWWGPNGTRAEAELILDSKDPGIIREILDLTAAPEGAFPEGTRTLPEGRIYHVLLFSTTEEIYGHLRFEYRCGQEDGSIMFQLRSAYDGASPVRFCPAFAEFERRRLEGK